MIALASPAKRHACDPAGAAQADRAREAVASDPDEFAGILRRCGGVDTVEALTAQGFARLMDHFTVIRFQCRQRPILSATTRKLIEATAQQLGLSPHVYAADLRCPALPLHDPGKHRPNRR